MKSLLFTVLILVILCGCSEQNPYRIEFCDTMNLKNECGSEANLFDIGSEIYVYLKSDKAFIDKKITVNVFEVEDGQLVGSLDILSKKDLQHVYSTHNLRFNMVGNYDVEFTNDKGEVLVTKMLFIDDMERLKQSQVSNESSVKIYNSLEEAFKEPKNVIKLNLSDQYIMEWPDSLKKLKNLKSLNMTKVAIDSVSESIGELKQLEELALSYNPMKTLPNSFGNLVNLKKLALVHCYFDSIPMSFSKLQNLEELYIDKDFPAKDLIRIKKDLNNCKIEIVEH